MPRKTAIIAGAGPAGLTAALELLRNTDYVPIIMEADGQVGGISKTVDYKGNKIDIGGHRFFSKSERVIKWWLEILPLEYSNQPATITYQNKRAQIQQGSAPANDEKVMLLRSRKSRILFNRKFFDYPLRLNLKTIRNLGVVKLGTSGMSYIYARIFPLKKEKNLAQFFRNRFGKELYETFFRDYTEKVWGVKCEDIPAEWGKQRVKDLSIGKVLGHAIKSFFKKDRSVSQKGTSTSLIEQFMYPKYGPGQMWETVAEEIKRLGGNILLNTKVTEIIAKDNRIISVKTKNHETGKTEELFTDVFFSTMPVKELVENLKGIEIPPIAKEIAAGLRYRDFLIAGLLLNKLAITEEGGLIKDNWIYLQDKGIKAGRVQIFNNWSPFMVPDASKVWIGVEFFCSEEEDFWKQPDKDIIAQAIAEMEQTGLISAADAEDAVVLKVKKAYPSYYGSYDRFAEVKDFLNSIHNLYCIGRNGMHKYNNSDHSMLTAMEAVEHLQHGGDKEKIWQINTEEDYHEEK